MSRLRGAKATIRSINERMSGWNNFISDCEDMERRGEVILPRDYGHDGSFWCDPDVERLWALSLCSAERVIAGCRARRTAYRLRGRLLRAQRTLISCAMEHRAPTGDAESLAVRVLASTYPTDLPPRLRTESKKWPWLAAWRKRRSERCGE